MLACANSRHKETRTVHPTERCTQELWDKRYTSLVQSYLRPLSQNFLYKKGELSFSLDGIRILATVGERDKDSYFQNLPYLRLSKILPRPLGSVTNFS
jgi:hypothetical protein